MIKYINIITLYSYFLFSWFIFIATNNTINAANPIIALLIISVIVNYTVKLYYYGLSEKPIKYFCLPTILGFKCCKFTIGIYLCSFYYLILLSKSLLLTNTFIILQLSLLPVIFVIMYFNKNQFATAIMCFLYGLSLNIITNFYIQNVIYLILVNSISLLLAITMLINKYYRYHGFLYSNTIIVHLVALLELFLFMITIIEFNAQGFYAF